jgi:hypothetical protein
MSEEKLTWEQKNPEKVQTIRRGVYYRHRTERINHHKAWKIANPEKMHLADKNWNENNRHKKRAQMIAARLIPLKRGCEICGDTHDLTRHHKDYGKPLEVLTLCKPCHRALEVAEPPVYTKQPEIRFYRGGEPVEILDNSDDSHRGQKWPCKVLSTGEIKYIVVGSLYYLPSERKRKHPTISKCANYLGPSKCKAKGICPYFYTASITRCADSLTISGKPTKTEDKLQ